MFKRIRVAVINAIMLVGQFYLLLIVLYRVIPVPLSNLMLIRLWENRLEHSYQLQHNWVSSQEIPLHFFHLVVTSEDPLFLSHYGFDFEQIENAVMANIKGKKLRGASTITQQLVKNLYLFPQRSYIRKILEIPLTLVTELLWTKKRILLVYINSIEMGKGIFGIEAAARYYYHKSAKSLGVLESASVVSCFPNPINRNPVKPDRTVIKHRNYIIYARKYVPIEGLQ